MQFNIRPQDLQLMITKLQQYASQMQGVGNSMRSTSRQLGATWKDPQYRSFLDGVEHMGRQLQANREQLDAMRQQLMTLKRDLEIAHQNQRRASVRRT